LWLNSPDLDAFSIFPPTSRHYPRPSEIFHRQCFVSFEPVERSLVLLADYLGSTNILWATDYPHFDGFWGAPNMIKQMGLPPNTLADVLAGGAKRYYGLEG
jgi:predicted TIM-barrel fold metal-dependent hydrolase